MANKWHFFRAGGVDQVSLRGGEDLRGLADLDQKLWIALAMPTRDVDVDPATMDLLDGDGDGRVRVPDILAAMKWADATWTDVNHILEGGDTLPLDRMKPGKVKSAAEHVLRDLGKKDAKSISLADATGVVSVFAQTTLNGDGVVIPESSEDAAVQQTIKDVIATTGSVADRSGKPGVDQAKLDTFFADVGKLASWLDSLDADPALRPLGDGTAAAASALDAVEAKIEDYFTRCQLAAFDARASGALGPQDADFAGVTGKTLTVGNEDIARLPLAKVEAGRALPLGASLNPAWRTRIEAFAAAAQHKGEALAEKDFRAIVGKLAGFRAKQAEKPATPVEALGRDRVVALAKSDQKAAVEKVIAADKALEGEYAEIIAVEKALRFQRDLARVLRNFVNFSDFYSDGDGVFQNGTLYVDGRAMRLCVPVSDAGKHGALAGMSAAYLLYCDVKRKGESKTIAVAVTNGDSDNLFVGRNGVYYDRQGRDWDATISKIVSNPISVREAFWSPYKKLVRMIEDQVGKRAAAADEAANARVTATATAVANADTAAAAAPPPATPPESPKKVDVGTVAAIGVAIGGIGALVVGVMSTFLGLGMWMPIGLASLLLLVSGPSMLLAWMKLRQRNLGPILDANGWAINGRARINVSFGAALTDLARLPPGSKRSLDDPYADKQRPWRFYTFLVLLIVLAATWYVGKLDSWLPSAAKSTSVLGDSAPAAKAAAPAPAPAPTPAPPPAK